jgi:ABC-type transporter Mla subunit MlaD
MKQIVFYALTAGLVLGAGCTKKNEDGTTERMTTEEVVVKTQETTVKATEKAAEVTAKATEATKQATQKTQEAVAALNVKADDVMADLNQSVEQIKEKVAGFDKTQLLAYADTYKEVLLEKKDQLAGLTDQLKGLSMTEMIGGKGQALKDQLAQYTDQFSGLKDRYGIYLDQLKTFGVDLSAYGL